MYLLLIILFLKSGSVEVRTSVVYGLEGTDKAYETCMSALPLTESLYERGKFHDGPAPDLISKVDGRCEPVIGENKLAKR